MSNITMFIEYALRSILISCGMQFAIFQMIDMAVIRQRRAWPAYLFMLTKTFLLSVTSQLAASRSKPSMSMANTLLNMFITAIVYWLIAWVWGDDALHTLLTFIVVEPIASCLIVSIAVVNMLEGRPAIELIGPLHPVDFLIPVLTFGGFYLLKPIVRKIMRFVGRLYLPHRKLLWLLVFGYFVFNHVPAFAGNNVGERANNVFFIEFVLLSASCCAAILFLVSSQVLMIRREKESIDMQLKLIEKRVGIISRIQREVQESRQIVCMQMKQMEQMMEEGTLIKPTRINAYLTNLRQAGTKEYRGTYFPNPLVDEILCEIQENAEAKGLSVLISMNGYQPGKVTQEDLLQLLYCIGFGAEGKEGNLELSIASSGDKLMLRMKSPLIHISRMRSILASQIVHSYGGSLIMEHAKDGQVIYMYL